MFCVRWSEMQFVVFTVYTAKVQITHTPALFLHVADPPRVTSHPQKQGAVVGELVMLTSEAIGTRPLSYHWEWKPAGSWQKAWQPCDAERFPWADSSSLTILSVQKSNCGGTLTSNPANLSVGKDPTINIYFKLDADRQENQLQLAHWKRFQKVCLVTNASNLFGCLMQLAELGVHKT